MTHINDNREQDVRVQMLDTFLACPHRNVDDLVTLHQQLAQMDPIFYAKLGVWAQNNTDVRDHKELFIAKMLTFDPEFPDVRNAGCALLQKLPPFQVNRVIDHVKGVSVKTKRAGRIFQPRYGRSVNRKMRSAIEKYLRDRETNRDWFDSAALADKAALKSIYCRAWVKPGTDHARAVLFPTEGVSVDAGSKYAWFKLLAGASDPETKARIITEHGIPYMAAVGAIKQITPALQLALVRAMSPSEVVNNLAAIKRTGGMNDPQVKGVVDMKLREAGTSSSVSALKANHAAATAKGLSDSEREALRNVSDQQVAKIKIRRKTGMLVDKSGSMEQSIELAKQIGAGISAVCEDEFICLAFDVAVLPIACKSGNLSDWENAFRGVRANGWTAIGAGIRWLREKRRAVEQLVIVSDLDERKPPYFVDEFQAYCREIGSTPNVVFVRVRGPYNPNAWREFVAKCDRAGIEYDMYEPGDRFDYYSMPNLLKLLTRKSKIDVVQEIYEIPLPTWP